MTILNELIHEGAYIVSEAPGFFSRDAIAISNAVQLVSGTVLGKPGNPSAETVVATADTNTGNGTLTMDPTAPLSAAAVDGAYKVEFTAATTFNVIQPSGKIAGKGSVGQTYAGPVKFSIAAGGTAFVAGDSFTITVARPDGTGDAWAPLAADGSVEAAGILFSQVNVPTTPGTQKAVAHVRNCEVRASDLTWPVGFTAPQIAEATLQLKRIGIVQR